MQREDHNNNNKSIYLNKCTQKGIALINLNKRAATSDSDYSTYSCINHCSQNSIIQARHLTEKILITLTFLTQPPYNLRHLCFSTRN